MSAVYQSMTLPRDTGPDQARAAFYRWRRFAMSDQLDVRIRPLQGYCLRAIADQMAAGPRISHVAVKNVLTGTRDAGQ